MAYAFNQVQNLVQGKPQKRGNLLGQIRDANQNTGAQQAVENKVIQPAQQQLTKNIADTQQQQTQYNQNQKQAASQIKPLDLGTIDKGIAGDSQANTTLRNTLTQPAAQVQKLNFAPQANAMVGDANKILQQQGQTASSAGLDSGLFNPAAASELQNAQARELQFNQKIIENEETQRAQGQVDSATSDAREKLKQDLMARRSNINAAVDENSAQGNAMANRNKNAGVESGQFQVNRQLDNAEKTQTADLLATLKQNKSSPQETKRVVDLLKNKFNELKNQGFVKSTNPMAGKSVTSDQANSFNSIGNLLGDGQQLTASNIQQTGFSGINQDDLSKKLEFNPKDFLSNYRKANPIQLGKMRKI